MEFETNEIKNDLTLEDIAPEKIVFNLEDEVELEDKVEEMTGETVEDKFTFELNESIEIEEEENDFSMEVKTDEVEESPFLMSDDSEEKKETIIWNLNDVINEEASNNEDSYHVSSVSENVPTDSNEPVYTKRIPEEEQKKLSAERIRRIKELGGRMKTPSGISDLEKEPAYKRRQISLDSIPHSSENTLSRFTLSEDEDGSPKLKDDNSFLHDNVD